MNVIAVGGERSMEAYAKTQNPVPRYQCKFGEGGLKPSYPSSSGFRNSPGPDQNSFAEFNLSSTNTSSCSSGMTH